MKKIWLLVLCLFFVISLTGCIKTHTYQVERKDQAIVGNRGYIMGEIPPPEPDRKRTRTITGVDVELPQSTGYRVRKKAIEEKPRRGKPSMREEIIEEIPEPRIKTKKEPIPEETMEEVEKEYRPQEVTYTIQKGDTLEKIAKKYLGKASRWTEIYEANKDTIEGPSKIYPGQVIVIPQGAVVEKEIEMEYK